MRCWRSADGRVVVEQVHASGTDYLELDGATVVAELTPADVDLAGLSAPARRLRHPPTARGRPGAGAAAAPDGAGLRGVRRLSPPRAGGRVLVLLPGDSHVHSEWSWDMRVGDMEGSCARALEVGLPAIAFTEHLDHTVWRIEMDGPYASETLTSIADPDGILAPPPFDASGYLEAIERCRERFPELRILSGAELGEPHRHAEEIERVLSAGRFDLLLGSLHSLPDGNVFA